MLGDDKKRHEYNRHRHQNNQASAGQSGFASTAQPEWGPTTTSSYRTYTTAAEKAREESQRKRQEWIDFEKTQGEKIVRSRMWVHELENECARLKRRMQLDDLVLMNDGPQWRSSLSPIRDGLSEEAKQDLRKRVAALKSSIASKQVELNAANEQLSQHEKELAQRRQQEQARLAQEQADRVARERENQARKKARNQADQQRKAAFEAAAQKAREAYEKEQEEIRKHWEQVNPEAFAAWSKAADEERAEYAAQKESIAKEKETQKKNQYSWRYAGESEDGEEDDDEP